MKDILILDDDPAMIWLYRHNLAKLGHTPRAARTVGEAMRLVRERLPDLMILDYDLPDGKGTDLLRALLHAGGGVPPVIMVTSQGSFLRREEMEGLEPAALFAKPFSPNHLIATVRELLGEGEA